MPARDPQQPRREFLRRLSVAGGGALVAGSLAWWRYDSEGPGAPAADAASFLYPDYRMPGLGPLLAAVTGEDRTAVVRKALELLGGLDSFIRPGDRVLLKVNAAFALPSLLCATTHPELLSEMVRLCRAAGAKEILVTDNPINDPASCFRLTGISAACEGAGAKVVLPHERLFQPLTLPGGRLLRDWPVLAAPFAGINKVIGLGPVKDHHRAGASLSLKNWYGLLGGRRNLFHQEIDQIVGELGQMIRPTLVILDGVQSMISNGPTGGSLADLKPTSTIIAGTDLVAADTLAAGLLGRDPASLPYLKLAQEAGLGTMDVASLKPRRAEVVR